MTLPNHLRTKFLELCVCNGSRMLTLPVCASDKGKSYQFDVAGFKIDAQSESTRKPRVVRVGLLQNRIVRPTTDSIEQQVFIRS